jgi:proline iminopeptidase
MVYGVWHDLGRFTRRSWLVLLCAASALAMSGASAAADRVVPGEIHDGYVQGCGAIIYYKIIGRGRPLIVLHGGPGSSHDYFLPYLLPLAEHRQLVFLDERGSGRSQRLSHVEQYTLAAMACDIDALRRVLKLGVTDVLGHSFGGILAQAYAIKYPTNVRRLILASTGSSAERLNADFKQIKETLKPDLRAQIDALEAKGICGADGAQLPEYRKLADEAEMPYDYAVRPPAWSGAPEDLGWDVLNEMWGSKSDFHIDGNLVGFDFTPQLHQLSLPTLIIAGDHDLTSTTTLEETHAAIPGSELVILKHSGHMTFVDQNDGFMDAVSRFLDK